MGDSGPWTAVRHDGGRYGNSPVYYMREQHQAAEMASGDASGSPKRDESRKSEKQVVLRFSHFWKMEKVNKNLRLWIRRKKRSFEQQNFGLSTNQKRVIFITEENKFL